MFGRTRKARNLASGNSSAKGYSYYSNTQKIDKADSTRSRSPKPISKKTNLRFLYKLPTHIALVAIIASIFYCLTLNTDAKIIQIQPTQNIFLQSANTYQAEARKLFAHSIFNRNKITVDINGITANLKRTFPELSDVSITMPLIGYRPLVYITPSRPSAIISSVNGAFVLNDRGFAILKTDDTSKLKQLNLPQVQDQSDIQVILGQQTLPEATIKFITDVTKQLGVAKQTVEAIILPTLSNQINVKIAKQPYVIKMNTANDSREQVGAYLVTWVNLKAKHQLPTSYFDVRIEGRVYYK